MIRDNIEVWLLIMVLFGSQHLEIFKTETKCLHMHEIVKRYDDHNVHCQIVVDINELTEYIIIM